MSTRLHEFSDPELAHRILTDLDETATSPWSIMEVCGGQTHTIIRNGIDQLLPEGISLIHGPGCPVCVTPIEIIDRALQISLQPDVLFCSFGDMLRVPGSHGDLFAARADGADVRVVYSPLDAVALAEQHPERQVVFFAVGFETTAPANAMAVEQASQRGLDNFSILVSHVLVPPAIEAILSAPDCRVDGFLAAGHVCTVMGTSEYDRIAAEHRVPIIVTGFEPLDVLDGIRRAVKQLEDGRAEVENAYPRAVKREGNEAARELLTRVFRPTDRQWRGIGSIAHSGWMLAPDYEKFDAELRFGVGEVRALESDLCRAGEVLQGLIRPDECPAFGTQCTPSHPLGAPMVSGEGACSAYHQYRA